MTSAAPFKCADCKHEYLTEYALKMHRYLRHGQPLPRDKDEDEQTQPEGS